MKKSSNNASEQNHVMAPRRPEVVAFTTLPYTLCFSLYMSEDHGPFELTHVALWG